MISPETHSRLVPNPLPLPTLADDARVENDLGVRPPLTFGIEKLRIRGLMVIALSGSLSFFCTQSSQAANLEVSRGVRVEVHVDQKGPFQFCVDTGLSEQVVISEGLARRLDLKVIGTSTMGDPSGKGDFAVQTVRVDSISVDSVTLTHLVSSIQPALSGPQSCDGILGLSFFKGYLVTLDLPNHRLTTEPGILVTGQQGVMRYTLDHGIPTIPLSVGADSFPAHIDSMGPGLSIPTALSTKLHFSAPLGVVGRGTTVSGSFDIMGGIMTDALGLGPYSFQNSFIEVNSHFPTAALGLAALRHFAITFDQKSQLVRLVSADTHVVIEPPRMRSSSPTTK